MALRIAEHVASGQIDNRVKGRITGFLELAGNARRVTLDLAGNGYPDLAGVLIQFRNPAPSPQPPSADLLASLQVGKAGDMTASRRAKEFLVPLETLVEQAGEAAFRYANCLYLEWFSEQNGRVVLEATGFTIEVLDGPTWRMTEQEFRAQAEDAAASLAGFMTDLTDDALTLEAALNEEDENVPPAETEMDAEVARLDLLTERIARRLEQEVDADWERIYEEESARLRRERGEPEPEPLTPEEEADRQCWLEELNASAQESLRDMASEAWKDSAHEADHPLVQECRTLALDLASNKLVPESASSEHPLAEISDSVLFASGKLAGALGHGARDIEWPPSEFAGPSILVFLKKARERLRDALRAMESADEENLATPEWRHQIRRRITRILVETQRLINDVREVLNEQEED